MFDGGASGVCSPHSFQLFNVHALSAPDHPVTLWTRSKVNHTVETYPLWQPSLARDVRRRKERRIMGHTIAQLGGTQGTKSQRS